MQEEKKAKLIVSYGIPGKKYVKSRGNVGFIVTDFAFLKAISIFPKTNTRGWILRSQYMMFYANLDPLTIVVKPRVVDSKFDDVAYRLYAFYRVTPEDFYLIYPDESLPFGTYETGKEFGSAPNAINKVEKAIDSEESFWKVRIGIEGAGGELSEIETSVLKHLGERMGSELGMY